MSRLLLSVSVFLLTLAACVWATVAISRGPIEQDLTDRSLEALERIEGFRPEYCQVAFVGRDGKVTGEVQSQELKDEVVGRMSRIYGARVVETDLIVRPFDEPWIMVESLGESEGVRLSGLLADEAAGNKFTAELKKRLGAKIPVTSEIEIREKVEAAGWLTALSPVAGELIEVADTPGLELRDRKLQLKGEMPDGDAKDALAVLATKNLDAKGIDLDLELTVAPPPEPSHFEMFPPDGQEIAVVGRLADLESAERLLSLLRSHAGDWIIKDQIVVAENTLPAPWVEGLTFLLPSVLNEVVEAGVKVQGSLVRIDGQIQEEMFDAVDSVATQNFPSPEYEIQNRLRRMTPPREAMVSVMIFPGDPVKLKGLLADKELKDRVVSAVKGAMDGGELLTDELQVDPNVLEAKWIDSLVGLIPPYVKQVKRGGLTIYSNILVANAVIDSDSERDSIWAMTEQFFPDDKYRRLLELQFPEEVDGGIAEGDQPGVDE